MRSYTKAKKYFKQKGEKITLTVITPFLINDPEKIYFIEKGSVNLSSTYTEKKQPVGKLYNFITIPNNQLFFGFPQSEKSSIMFYVDAEEDSTLWEIDISDIQGKIKNADLQNEIDDLLFVWIKNLYSAINEDTTVNRPNSTEIVDSPGQYKFEKEQFLSGVNNVLFFETRDEDCFLFNGHIEMHINESVIIPFTKYALFKIKNKVEIKVTKQSSICNNASFWIGIRILHEFVIQSDDYEAQQYKSIYKKRINKKYELLSEDYQNIFSKAKNLLEKETAFNVIENEAIGNNAFWNATLMVANAESIKLIRPPELDKSTDTIGDIARFSGIRYREVILEGEWYKIKSGISLIGFNPETNTPIALIYTNNNYNAYDFESNTTLVVNKQNQKKIGRIAYMLYKPLPDEKLSLKALIKYAFLDKKKDVKKLLFASFLSALMSLVLPLLNTVIFDDIIPNAQRSQLWYVGYALAVAAIGGIFFELAKSISIVRLRGLVNGNLQPAVWDRLLALPTEFFRNYTSGDLAERSLAVSQMAGLLSGVTLNSIISGVFSLFNFAFLFYLSAKLALITLLLAMFLILVTVLLGKRQVKLQNEILNQEGENSGFVLQLLTGIATLKVSGNESKAFLQWFDRFLKTRKFEIELEQSQNIQKIFTSSFYMLSLIIIYFSMIKLSDGSFTTGKFLAFNAAYGAVIFALMGVSSSVIEALKIIPVFNRLKPIIEAEPEDAGAKSVPSTLKGNIEISKVNFRYDPGNPLVLKDISLKIKNGEYVAFVGPSGCGKSTLIRLLLGFEHPELGAILYEGQDLENIDVKLLRKQIGVVLQDGSLMGGDIFTNIIGSSSSLTLEDAWQAAKNAAFDKDIEEMPMGMFTVVTDEGGTLSGGQKQRLMIARALVHKPKILIFDEATSALDNRTQAIVTETLDAIQVTRIVVAHRLSTIMDADRIIYFDKGGIQEQGSFDELMAVKGQFYKLASRQL